MRASTIDKRYLAGLYLPPRTPVIVDVPPMIYLMVDGHGDPRTTLAWAEAIDALQAVSAAIEAALSRLNRPVTASHAFSEMPIEALVGAAPEGLGHEKATAWTVLVAQPPLASPDVVKLAVEAANRLAPLPATALVRRERLHEGWSAQMLDVGPCEPCAPDGAVLDRLDAFISRHGYRAHGRRHEIYLDDAATTAPDQRRTIIRQPVLPGG